MSKSPRPKRPLLVRVATWALIAFLVGLPLGLGFVQYTTRPDFCSSCHIMEPYVESWRHSAHNQVPCVDCHYEPGLLETLDGKFKAINQVVKYVTGTEGTKPWAEVSDNSCMRAGCHSTRLLAGTVEFQLGRTTIPFDHTPHLTEMRREKKLRCTSCHSQIVQGEHLTVTTSTCMLCHFKGGEEDPKLSQCTTCHRPPEGPIDVGGFKFEHAAYLARGVGCESCHADITQGTGEVVPRRCGSCHAVQEHIERIGETEFMHRTHVTDHKVDCLECHNEMTHRLRDRKQTAKGECAQCHEDGHGIAETFYRGEGGRGVAATPNPMYLTRIGCSGCHIHPPAAKGDGAAPGSVPATAASEVACISCHGPAYEGLLGRWQAAIGPATDAVAAEVDAARAAATKAGAAAADLAGPLQDAHHDVALLRADGSRGAHNPWFARKLLESSFEKAATALRRLDPERPAAAFPLGPSFETKLDCAQVCHVGVETRDARVPGTRFVHAQHVGRAGDCDACHTTPADGGHGKTRVGKDDCAACHHGPKAAATRTCASCHAETDAFLRGVSADGDEGVQMMAKVACTECHGAEPKGAPRATVQAQCDRCHGEKYEGAVAEWTADSDAWFAEAEARLAKARAKAGDDAARQAKVAEAAALVARLRRIGPAHNVLLFEETKEQFDELVP